MTDYARSSIAVAALIVMAAPAAALEVEALWRVSVASDGTEAVDSHSDECCFGPSEPSISADGRFVTFVSASNNLVPDDTNDGPDVFLYTLATGEIIRVSVASDGSQTDSPPYWGDETSAVADTGDVVFVSLADNLVPNDTNGSGDVFVHSPSTGVTERISVAPDGTEAVSQLDAANSVSNVGITPDGRFVVYRSRFSDLIPNDTNDTSDIFVRDRAASETALVSVDQDGSSLGARFPLPRITPDGRFVVFQGPGPAPFIDDIYVKDLATGELWLDSLNSDGDFLQVPEFGVANPSISDDGRFVVFDTNATNIPSTAPEGTHFIALRDRELGETTALIEGPAVQSTLPPPLQWDGVADPTISGDGRFVTATLGCSPPQLIVHDRQTGETIRVSVAPDGRVGNGRSYRAAVSGDGRLIAFRSEASNLVDGDTNGIADIFVARIGDGNGPRGSFQDPTDTDADGFPDDCDADDDGDEMSDVWETQFGLDPLDPADAGFDGDNDGLTNLEEWHAHTDPTIPDTDGDAILDGADNCPNDANADQADFDGDGQGDACDIDDDNDNVIDISDAYPLDPTRSQPDTPPPSGGSGTSSNGGGSGGSGGSSSGGSSSGGSGGGGSIGFVDLLLLAGAARLRLRRRGGTHAT